MGCRNGRTAAVHARVPLAWPRVSVPGWPLPPGFPRAVPRSFGSLSRWARAGGVLSAGATLTTKIFFEVVLRLGFVLNRGLLLLWLGLHELRLTAAPGDQAGSADTNSLRGQASDQM